MIQRPQHVKDAIIADEVGMQYGRYGDYVIQSAYQPILRNGAGSLRPVAVEGLALVSANGRRIPSGELFANSAPGDKLFIDSMCKALHLRNFKQSGVDHLDLYFKFDPGTCGNLGPAIHEIRYAARQMHELGINPRTLVCEITEAVAVDDGMLLEIVQETRRHGIRIAIDDFGAGQSGWERCDLVAPDLVKIDAAWFQRLMVERGTAGLLARLIEQFGEREIPVLIEGIETPLHLQAALDAGVELFQGYLFGRPALAGSVFSDQPVALSSLLGTAPLFSMLQAEQQKRMYF